MSAGAPGADTLATVALTGERAIAAAIPHWHEFYLLAGTAAVTLVGLLFVALSFHLDTLLSDEKSHLLGAARLAFSSFLYVLLISLAFLVPGLRPRLLDAMLLTLSSVTLLNTLWVIIQHRRRGDALGPDRFLLRRYAALGVVAGIAITTATEFLIEPRPSWFFNFATITAIMLMTSAGTSWDLLVQVGKQKLAKERRPHA